MNGLDWLDGGPEEWNRWYVASHPTWSAVVVVLVMALMPLLGKEPRNLPARRGHTLELPE